MTPAIFSWKRSKALTLALFSAAALVACGGGGGGGDIEDVVPRVQTQNTASPLSGAIFTALEESCSTTNTNIYETKQHVWLNGGPRRPGSAGLLPNTDYYVQVTTPSGHLVLGTSVNETAPANRPVRTNALGNFEQCYHLWAIVKRLNGTDGYDDTTNNGGEYKVWVSTEPDFVNSSTKTDNFKVRDREGPPPPPPPPEGEVTIKKWYDANANGEWDNGEVEIFGWKVDLTGFDPKSTSALFEGVPLEDVNAREFQPDQDNWLATNAYVNDHASNPVSGNPVILNQINVPLSGQMPSATVYFGNVCLGAGGGKTLGFWSNKNGQGRMNDYGMANALAELSALNLRNAAGEHFNPGNYAQFRNWLLGGTATNMAYMLSVQLAAMKLNVLTGGVSGDAMVYAPGVEGANGMGFISINNLMAAANTSLGLYGLTLSGHEQRTAQALMKDALDDANNNENFVQANPCDFSFTPPVAE